MYETYYGFAEKPFNLTPDPKYLYQSRRHTEAVAHLEYGRRERGGFIVITGEVGTGKTTLARYFLGRLPEGTATAVVLYPALTAAELLQTILDDLKAPREGGSLKELVDALHRFLLKARGEGRDVVLLIDEAQDLSPDVLEQIRLISNLETDTEKLIQIVLIGQSELGEMLDRRELRQLAQRVTARYHLAPLSRQETDDYVRHRLAVAGGAGKVTFRGQGSRRGARPLRRHPPPHQPDLRPGPARRLRPGHARDRGRDGEGGRPGSGGPRAPRGPRAPPLRRRHRRRARPGRPRLCPGVPATALRARRGPGARRDAARAGRGGNTRTLFPSPLRRPSLAALEPRLLGLSRDTSYGAAAARIQGLWQGAPLVRTPLRTHLPQVKRLDLPVLLEMFHPARRDTCFLALLGVAGDEATVAVGDEPPFRVSLAELDRYWTRNAVFLWRDFDAVSSGEDTLRHRGVGAYTARAAGLRYVRPRNRSCASNARATSSRTEWWEAAPS